MLVTGDDEGERENENGWISKHGGVVTRPSAKATIGEMVWKDGDEGVTE